MSRKDNNSFIHNFLHAYRHVLIYIVVTTLFACTFFSRFEKSMVGIVQGEYDSLCNAISVESDAANTARELTTMNATMRKNSDATRFRMKVLELGSKRITKELLMEFSQDLGSDKTFFFLTDYGNNFSTSEGELNLNEKQVETLLQRGSYVQNGVCYFTADAANGTLVMEMPAPDDADMPDLAVYYTCDSFTYLTDTGKIVDVYGDELESELLGRNITDFNIKKITDENLILQDGKELVSICPKNAGFRIFSDSMIAVKSDRASDGTTETYYFAPSSYVIYSSIRTISVPMLLMAVFTFISLHTAIFYRKRWKESRIQGKEIKIGKNVRIDSEMAKNIMFVQGCFMVLVITISLFVQSLADFTSLYEDSQYHLNGLVFTAEQNQKIEGYVQNIFEEDLRNSTNSVVQYLNKESNPENIQTYLEQMKVAIGAEEISVYDANGIIEYSTNSYVGYQLSNLEQNPEFKLWELVDGGQDTILYELDEDSGLYCCGARRQDGIGIVSIKMTDYAIHTIKEKVRIDNAALNTDFETSDRLFVSASNPTVLYRIPAGEKEAETLVNHLKVLDNLEQTTTITRIGRSRYFVCGLGYNNVTIYNADPVQPIVARTLNMGWWMLIFCMLVSLAALLGSCIYTQDTERWGKVNTRMTKEEIGRIQRGSLYYGWVAASSLTGIILLVDYIISDESILEFLFYSQWQRGLNLFAFAMMILSVAVAVFATRLLQRFFRTLCNSLSSYSKTVCHMLSSILTLCIYVCMVFYTLTQFGIDARAIVAGIGITGLAISFAAKSTIEDMLSGIFIIMDGHARVGDFIKVGNYEGEITHIGIRTTKIHRFHTEISVNNSEMRNIIDCSKGKFEKPVFFTVPFGTDVEQLKKIIEANGERFMKAGGGLILEPPKFTGVFGYQFYGMRIRLLLNSKVDKEDAAKAKFYTELTQILKENNIHIRG